MGGTQNFVHGIYRDKIPRYRVYRGTCFVIVVTSVISVVVFQFQFQLKFLITRFFSYY